MSEPQVMDPSDDPTADDDCGAVAADYHDTLMDNLVSLTAAACGVLPDICSYGLTIGENYVPFNPDDEDECEHNDPNVWACSQAWVRVTNIVPINTSEGFRGQCAASLRLTLEVGVLRCFATMDEGEAPTASEVLQAAENSMADMTNMYRGAMSTQDSWDGLSVGQWRPMGPAGGQYGGQWTIQADLT